MLILPAGNVEAVLFAVLFAVGPVVLSVLGLHDTIADDVVEAEVDGVTPDTDVLVLDEDGVDLDMEWDVDEDVGVKLLVDV